MVNLSAHSWLSQCVATEILVLPPDAVTAPSTELPNRALTLIDRIRSAASRGETVTVAAEPPCSTRETVVERADKPLSAYADDMDTLIAADSNDPLQELKAIAELKRELSRREEVAVRRARHSGMSWAQIGFLLGVTKQTIHRKYKKVG